jgi:hypothetical protein
MSLLCLGQPQAVVTKTTVPKSPSTCQAHASQPLRARCRSRGELSRCGGSERANKRHRHTNASSTWLVGSVDDAGLRCWRTAGCPPCTNCWHFVGAQPGALPAGLRSRQRNGRRLQLHPQLQPASPWWRRAIPASMQHGLPGPTCDSERGAAAAECVHEHRNLQAVRHTRSAWSLPTTAAAAKPSPPRVHGAADGSKLGPARPLVRLHAANGGGAAGAHFNISTARRRRHAARASAPRRCCGRCDAASLSC